MDYIFIAIVGLGLGSFVNAWVWRTRQVLDDDGNSKKLSKVKKAELSIVKGRSMCPSCKHTLATADLVPVFSWVYLRGKCRYCRTPISAQYPIVELITAVLYVVSYLVWDLSENWYYAAFITWLIGLTALIALAIYDAKWLVLPNKMLLPAYALVGLGILMQFGLGRPIGDLLQISLAIAICSGLFWVLYNISKGQWIGGGDVKLGLLTGALIGTAAGAFISLFIASVLGLVWSVALMAKGKAGMKSQIPFGPFLIAGAICAVLFTQDIVGWYESLVYIDV